MQATYLANFITNSYTLYVLMESDLRLKSSMHAAFVITHRHSLYNHSSMVLHKFVIDDIQHFFVQGTQRYLRETADHGDNILVMYGNVGLSSILRIEPASEPKNFGAQKA